MGFLQEVQIGRIISSPLLIDLNDLNLQYKLCFSFRIEDA